MKLTSIAGLLAVGLAASVPLAGTAAAQGAPPAPGKPADLCQELVAFVKQPEPAKQAAATPASQATAVSNPSGKTEGAKPGGGSEPQNKSGLSGPPAEAAPKPGPAADAKSDPKVSDPAVNPRAKANADAKGPPAPGTPAPTPKPDAATVERIEAAAAAGDLAACRAAARSMRVAGVALPPPLLALAALDPKFFQP